MELKDYSIGTRSELEPMSTPTATRGESSTSGATVRLDDSLDGSLDSEESQGHINRVFGDSTSDESLTVDASMCDQNLNFLNTTWQYDSAWTSRLAATHVFGNVKMYGPPLLLRCYIDADGSAKAQIGDFRNVGLGYDEIIACINSQPRFTPTTFLAVMLEGCTSINNVLTYLNVLSMVLNPFPPTAHRPAFEKCMFSMDNYTYANGVLGFLKIHLNSLLELDIGYSMDYRICFERNLKDLSLEPAQMEFILKEWLGTLSRTIRCLRVYEMISLTPELASILSACFNLVHLTVSRVFDISSSWSFPVKSMEYDGQYLAYTDSDIRLLKLLPSMFPYCRHFSFVGVMYHPCINAFLGSRRLLGSPGSYHVYQPAIDIAHLLKTMATCYQLDEEVPQMDRKRRMGMMGPADQETNKFVDLVAINDKEVKLRIYKKGEKFQTQIQSNLNG